MQVNYSNKRIANLFENYSKMQKAIGFERTKAIKKHMNNIKASNNFSIYMSIGLGKPHPLEAGLKNCFGIWVTRNIRLIVEPQAENFNVNSLKLCKSVIVKGVCDYHGGKEEWIIS